MQASISTLVSTWLLCSHTFARRFYNYWAVIGFEALLLIPWFITPIIVGVSGVFSLASGGGRSSSSGSGSSYGRTSSTSSGSYRYREGSGTISEAKFFGQVMIAAAILSAANM